MVGECERGEDEDELGLREDIDLERDRSGEGRPVIDMDSWGRWLLGVEAVVNRNNVGNCPGGNMGIAGLLGFCWLIRPSPLELERSRYVPRSSMIS